MPDDFGFAPPPFNADNALLSLKRFVRDLRALAERNDGFTFGGQPVLQLSSADGAVLAKLARRAGRTPEWDSYKLSNQIELRKLQDEIKRRFARWADGRDE
jgi:hypothetical protein